MRSLILAVALTLPGLLHAADEDGEFAIKGAGLQTCGALLTAWDQKSTDLAFYVGWIDGYLTGMNQHYDGTFDAAPWQSSTTLVGLTRELCLRRATNDRIMDVFNDLMRDFLPQRLQTKSGATAVRSSDQALVLYTETVKRMQQRLTDEGHYLGVINGNFDAPTSAALEAFQKARSLDPTGLPDQKTLFTLFVRTSN